MSVRILQDHPDPGLAAELARFEREFTYPLGDDRRFHVEHGRDCWRFFEAMGDAAYAVVEDNGRVHGVLGAAMRRIVRPDGIEIPALYVGDLKIATQSRGGLVLIRLIRAIEAWRAGARAHSPAFSVVMDGTALTPTAYTGRAGVPAFRAVDSLVVVWLRTAPAAGSPVVAIDGARGLPVFLDLAAGQYRLPYGNPATRSILEPRWLITENGEACGRLEDTLRAKRLCTIGGEDMRSAHLSCFAFRRIADGLQVLLSALSRAAEAGYPMLFAAMTPAHAEAVRQVLGDQVRSLAPATVFATGLTTQGRWNINTAEI